MESPTSAEKLVELADLLRPSAIRAFATLGVANHINAGFTTSAELARRCGAQQDAMDTLLRYAASLELVTYHPDQDTYQLAALGQCLVDEPGLAQHLSMDDLFGRGEAAFVNLIDTIRTGRPAHVGLYGTGYWDSVNNDPRFVESFEKRYVEQVSMDADLILDHYDWSNVGHVVDVGGHTGALLALLARRYSHLRGTLLDLKNAAEVAGKNFAKAGLADRCQAVVGSFFDPLPAGGDVYLLSAILADWDDEQAIEILRRCAQAAGSGARVLLAEVSMAPMAGTTPYLDLYIRATMPAPARTVAQLIALAEAAGLRLTWQGPETETRSLLEFQV